MALTSGQIRHYRQDGFVVAPALFDAPTVARMVEHYMARRAEGAKPGDMGGDAKDATDPLNKYPRMIQMHNWDPASKDWALEKKMLGMVKQLIDDEPVLKQTMLYFKPPGARGQGLHQDEQYITMDPLIGVWVALDQTDRANGQMVVVPGSHKLGMLPVEQADRAQSFVKGQTIMPEGASEVGVDMNPGDALFFDGKTIHGSYNNQTQDRFRRSFICHFIGKHSCEFEPAVGTSMKYVKVG